MDRYLDVGDSPIHWRDYGGSGPLLVLIHGLGGSIASWDLIGPRLANTHRVVAMDLPGFGLSPPWRDYELDTHARAVTRFLEHFNERATLVGNSLGGLLCEIVAAREPELVESLVLIAPATPPTLPDPNVKPRNATRVVLTSLPGIGVAINRHLVKTRTSKELIDESLDRISHRKSHVPLDLIGSLVETAEMRRKLPWATEAIPRTGASLRKWFVRRSLLVSTIREIKAPTLVVQGLDDPLVSAQSVRWLCSLRSDWTLVQFEGSGHTPQIDAPVRLLNVIEPWLDDRQIGRIAV